MRFELVSIEMLSVVPEAGRMTLTTEPSALLLPFSNVTERPLLRQPLGIFDRLMRSTQIPGLPRM